MNTGFKVIRNPLVPIIAAGVAIGALVAITSSFLALVETGTCASGGQPYVISRPCPDQTEGQALLLVGGIFAYVIALVVLALSNPPAGIFMFGVLFLVLGVAFLATEVSDSFGGNMGGAGWILGPMFILFMGLPAMYVGVKGWAAARRRAERQSRQVH